MPPETTTFNYRNGHSKPVDLIIEPWALIEVVPSKGEMTFEINVEPLPEIEFSTTKDGDPLVFVMSEHVRIYVCGVMKHEYHVERRPPAGSFRLVNDLVFSQVSEAQVKPEKPKAPFWQFWK